MALVKGRYYQKSERINGQVRTRYICSGEQATLLWEMDKLIAAERAEERAALLAERGKVDQAYKVERDRGKVIRLLVTIALEALGFIRHGRNPWRRRSTMSQLPAPTLSKLDEKALREKLRDAVDDAAFMDPAAIETLRQYSRANPYAFATEFLCDIAQLARWALALAEYPKKTGKDPARAVEQQKETVARMNLMARELAGENPSPARQLCAQVIAFASYEHWSVTMQSASSRFLSDLDPRAGRRRNGAHKRLMTALRTFAQIEQAERPKSRMVQVNVTPNMHGGTRRITNRGQASRGQVARNQT
jgi:hypothetical protein